MLRRERETMRHHKFTWKISEEIKKPQAYYWLKTSTMKNKIWIQSFTLLKPTNLSQTTWLVHSFSASQLLLSGHTWSLHQARFLLEFIQEENGFLHKTKRMRDECFRNQPLFIFRKSIFFFKFLENLDGFSS